MRADGMCILGKKSPNIGSTRRSPMNPKGQSLKLRALLGRKHRISSGVGLGIRIFQSPMFGTDAGFRGLYPIQLHTIETQQPFFNELT